MLTRNPMSIDPIMGSAGKMCSWKKAKKVIQNICGNTVVSKKAHMCGT